MQGITDDSITFFSSMPKAGPLAGFGLIADGINSYFKYINETNGGVDGHKLDARGQGRRLPARQDQVQRRRGARPEQVRRHARRSSARRTTWPIWDTLNDECMPQLLNGTGAPQWGDIDNHPWTTGMQLDYASEAGLWAEWLKTEHPDKTKVAALTFNNDFGKSYVNGFAQFIKGSDIQVVDQEFHEPTAPDVTNQLTTIAASGADVVLLETTGTFCTQAMAELEKNTSFNPIVIMSGTCGSLSQFFQPLIDQGLTGDDTHIIQYLKDVNDPQYADDDDRQAVPRDGEGAGPRRQADDVRHGLDLRHVHGGDRQGSCHLRGRRRPRQHRASLHGTSRSRTRSPSTASARARTSPRTPTSSRAAGW